MASSARRRKTAWARTVRAATHSSCRSVAWSPSPSAPSRAAAALEILRRKPAAFGSQAPVVSATRGKNSTPCPRHAAAVSKWAALVSAYAEAAARLVRAASPKVSCREGAVTARSKAVGEPRYEGTYKSAGRRRMLLESSGVAGVLPSFSLAATPLGQPKLRGCPGVRGGGQYARLLHSTAHTHTHAKEKKTEKKNVRYLEIWG